MTLNDLIKKMKQHPRYRDAGMILYHNGTVRNSSRSGNPVTGLKIHVDHDKLAKLLERQKRRKGIVEILVHIIEEKDLLPGEDVMYLAVAGDIRERVIAVLTDTLEEIKTDVTWKEEYFPG